jgi:hypothetical protein
VRNPAHSEDKLFHPPAPRRGIEPRLAVPKTAVPPPHSQGKQCPDLDLNQDHELRRLGCDPLHHQDQFLGQSRRLDLHQYQPVYKTGASLFGHVGKAGPRGVEPREAALETACSPRSTIL